MKFQARKEAVAVNFSEENEKEKNMKSSLWREKKKKKMIFLTLEIRMLF